MSRTHTPLGQVGVPHADHPGMEQVARNLFARNAGDYADPVTIELAWVDIDIRCFWQDQAEAVRADLECLSQRGHI